MSVEPPADPRARLRASDTDRELVIEQLRAYLSEGRLTIEEYEERSALTYASKTYGELWEVTRDLPAPRARGGPPVRARPPDTSDPIGRMAWKFLVINAFLVMIWALTGAGYFWPIWPALSCALVLGLRAVNRDRRPT